MSASPGTPGGSGTPDGSGSGAVPGAAGTPNTSGTPSTSASGGVADVVVVGGGVAGLGVAWRLAQRGASVVVADATPGLGASDVGAGMIAPVTEATATEPELLGLTRESAARWPGFAAELEEAAGRSVGYRDEATLAVALDADDHRVLLDLYDLQVELGLEVERLRSSECRALEAGLAPQVRGGLLVTADHQVDNRALTEVLLVACERAGVELRAEGVDRVVVERERVRGVVLAGGDELGAGTVVVAAGCWSSQLGGLPAEVLPPVRPVKGQILRLAGSADAPIVGRTVRGLVEGSPIYLVPRSDGRVVVGGTVEEQGYDVTVTAGAVRDLLDDAFALVPEVTELELVEVRAGLRPGTPDNAPILGRCALEGLVMATGHHRHGFLLLPVTADEVAAVVAGGETSGVLAPFGPQRFVGEGVAS